MLNKTESEAREDGERVIGPLASCRVRGCSLARYTQFRTHSHGHTQRRTRCAEPSIRAQYAEPMWQVVCCKNSATNKNAHKHSHTASVFFSWRWHSAASVDWRSLEMLRPWSVWNNHHNTGSGDDFASAGPLIISITGTSWLHLKAINVSSERDCLSPRHVQK